MGKRRARPFVLTEAVANMVATVHVWAFGFLGRVDALLTAGTGGWSR